MLKFQLDTLEGVDEAVRALYTEKDGKFVLGIEGLPQQEDVSGLKAKVDELLGEKKAAEKKAREAEEAARLEREELARKSGNVEELERSWTEKFTRREAELTGTLEQERATLSGQIRDLTVGRTATDIASALAVQGSAKALLPHIERRLSVEQRDGKPVVVVLDAQGKLSFADFTKSILADMARIATRQASSALLSSLVGAATSYFTGGGGGNGLSAGSAGATSSNLGASSAGYSSNYFPQALGGAWSSGVQMFANGGAFTNSIVSTPTAFGMAGGRAGVMGEAGPEAIMPLTRTSSGKLGVLAAGGGSGTAISISAPVTVVTQDQGAEGMQIDQQALSRNLQSQMQAVAEKAVADSWRVGGTSFRNANGRA